MRDKLFTGVLFALAVTLNTAWAEQPLRVAFIPKGATHAFWREVARGAVDEAAALQIKLVLRGPANEDGIDAQSRIMQIYTESDYDGIVLAPNSTTELTKQIDATLAKGLKIIVVDSPLDGYANLPYVGTDNFKAGALAARQVAKDLPDAHRVLLLRYSPQHGSTTARETGFLQTLQKLLPKADVVDTYFAGLSVVESQGRLESILAKDSRFDVVFTPNETTTEGANRALRKLKMADKLHHYGFDYTAQIDAALRDGSLNGVVMQDPYQMGRKSTAMMVDLLQNRAIPKTLETPVFMVTPGNIDTDTIRALTDPLVKIPARR